MARDLKVYGMTIMSRRDDNLGTSPQVSAIVAATTKVEAARLLGVRIGEFNMYSSPTGNEKALATAKAKPGQVFARALNDWDGDYVEIERKPHVPIPRRVHVPYSPPPIPVRFTIEELEMIAGYFANGNSPLAQSINEKAMAMIGSKPKKLSEV